MASVGQDIRFAVRTLAREKGFTIAAVLCLALGIGVNTVIFSAVNAILLRPFPYQEPDALVAIRQTNERQRLDDNEVSPYDYVEWQRQTRSFESMGAYANTLFTLVGDDGDAENVQGGAITWSMFGTLGVRPIIGRDFQPEDDVPNGPAVVLLSHALWEQRFQGDSAVVGTTVRLNGRETVILGVMPRDFEFPGRARAWRPLQRDPETSRGQHFLDVVARIRPGVSLSAAEAEVNGVAAQLAERFPESNREWGASVVSLREHEVGETAPVLLLMQGAVLFVLLIACANVANLMLVRSASRHRELAIRTTLGAGRGQIVRQLLTESVVVALVGAALGALLAVWGLDLVLAMIPDFLPFWMRFEIDGTVLAFTTGLAVATGLVFGLAPALQASRVELHDALKEGGRTSSGGARQRRLRNALIVAEVALSLVLLAGAGLMMKSFLRLQSEPPGFSPEGRLALSVNLRDPRYDSLFVRTEALQRAFARIEAIPGVVDASAVSLFPLSGASTGTAFFLEREAIVAGQEHGAENRSVFPDYFALMNTPMLRGRTFTAQELADSARVLIVNRTLADRFFPGQDPTGERLRLGPNASSPLFTIVGVVADVRQRELGVAPEPQLYLPYTRQPSREMTLVVRSAAGDPASLVPAIRAAVRAEAPNVPVFGVATAQEIVEQSLWQERLYGRLFASFAVIALVLASVGVYGVIAYAVSQRTHEIGVRVALGANPREIFALVLRSGVVLSVAGVALGLAGALALTRLLDGLLYGVSVRDPAIFTGVPLLLVAVAVLAGVIPARRATSVDPVEALRVE